MEVFRLSQPDISGHIDKVMQQVLKRGDVFEFVESTNRPEYLFWDKVKYKPRPEHMTPEDFWTFVKLLRRYSPSRANTIIVDEKARPFSWQLLPGQDFLLHEIDMHLGGRLQSQYVEDAAVRQKFIARGIMEEAIASSQLEGANTTRRVAKRMLLEKRAPVNTSEKMILNNYNAMLAVENELCRQKLSVDLLLDLHVTLTRDTIDKSEVGRFRRDRDEIVVCDPATNIVYHVCPAEKFLKREIGRFIRYANDESDRGRFVHPVLKAIFLHFWMGFLHPFTDGNGRIARTIFYWYLLKKNYWAFAYLPVSRVIRKSPAQYRDAYIYTEQDDNDLTYFIDYNLRKIAQAKREFEHYVEKKGSENRKMTAMARSKFNLNDRQIQLLMYLYKNSDASTSIKMHSRIYGVSRMTARKDLERLEELGLLSSEKIGRTRPFRGTARISQLF